MSSRITIGLLDVVPAINIQGAGSTSNYRACLERFGRSWYLRDYLLVNAAEYRVGEFVGDQGFEAKPSS